VTRENRIDELRDDRLVESDDAWKDRLSGLQFEDEIVANFLFDRPQGGAGSTQVSERFNWGGHEPILSRLQPDYTTSPLLHPFFDARRPRVFAHRGGASLAPENTIVAFDRGLALGADGLELDVHLSRDGIVVVHHDRHLERTTDLRGPLAHYTAEELARADAGYHFTPVPPGQRSADTTDAESHGQTPQSYPFRGQGVGIPTLAAVVARYRDVPIIIELKGNDVELARRAVAVVREADAIERVCLGSFSLRAIREARRIEPRLATSAAREEVRWALYRSKWRWPVARVGYQGYQVPEWSGRTQMVSRRFVEDAHRANLGVQVWTVNAAEVAHRLLDHGVDALITDRPDIMVPLIRSRSTRNIVEAVSNMDVSTPD
jgi:glycerophosphoryl diester phosphodiesterase